MSNTQHNCANIPKHGISVVRAYEMVRPETWSWCLLVTREATREHLEQNGHLECLDEVIWETIVEISHCPYCGAGLPDASLQGKDAEFVHHDYSGYFMEVL